MTIPVTILYRTTDPKLPIRTLEVFPGHPLHARALWLATPVKSRAILDCTIERVPEDARIGDGQDDAAYCSPHYARPPRLAQVLDDEERRRRFVEQARRVAAWLRREGREAEGGTFRRLAAVAVVVGLLACAPAPPELGAREQAAAAEALAAGEVLAQKTPDPSAADKSGEPLAGYVIRAGEFVLWTLPTADPGPPPEGAVARYDVATGRVTALRRAQ